MRTNAYPALILNADFQPLNMFPLSTMPWQDAVAAVVKDTVAVVSEYDVEVHSPSTTIKLPSVVALRDFVPAPKRVAFTRFNVFLRDRFRCQYCSDQFSSSDLTFDHVTPRSMGGVTAWDNIVAACSPCNTKKDKHLLKPRKWPKEPTVHEMMAVKRLFPPNHLHKSWLDFLYWDSELSEG